MKNLEKKLIGNIVPVPSFYKHNLDLDFISLGKFLEFQIKHKVKRKNGWSDASEFYQQLGFHVSHGISPESKKMVKDRIRN